MQVLNTRFKYFKPICHVKSVVHHNLDSLTFPKDNLHIGSKKQRKENNIWLLLLLKKTYIVWPV